MMDDRIQEHNKNSGDRGSSHLLSLPIILHLYKKRSNIFLSHRNVARVNVMLCVSHTKAAMSTV